MLGQETKEHVRLRLGAVWVLLQTLVPRVITFNADAPGFFLFPHSDESETMAGRERRIDSSPGLKLARVNVSIAGSGGEGGLSQSAEKFDTGVVGGLGEIDELVALDALDVDGVPHAGIE